MALDTNRKTTCFEKPPMIVAGGLGTRNYNTTSPSDRIWPHRPLLSIIACHNTNIKVRAAATAPNSAIRARAVVVSHHEIIQFAVQIYNNGVVQL